MMERQWHPREFCDIDTSRLEVVGLRPTPMRLMLLDLFEQHKGCPLSCEEVYRLLIGAGLDVNLSSIYTNVRILVGGGVLTRREARKKVRLSATFEILHASR